MVKKVKIDDLTDDEELIEPGEGSKKKIEKISIDELQELDEEQNSALVIKSPKKQISKEKDVNHKKTRKFLFNRSFYKTYFFKLVSCSFICGIIDGVNYLFLCWLDRYNVLEFERFESLFIANDYKNTAAFIVFLLLFGYFITPSKGIMLSRHGIYCSKNNMVNLLFFVSTNKFLLWKDISDVRFKFSFFEPFIFIYDINENLVGSLNFSLEKEKEFFKHVKEFAGEDHPLYLVKSKIASV